MRIVPVTSALLGLFLGFGLEPRAEAQTIVLESHAKARPDDAGDLMGPVLKALAGKQVVGGAALEGRISDALSRPASSLDGNHLPTAARLVQRAESLAKKKLHAQIVRILPAAVDVYRAAPGAIAGDEATRDRAFRARVLLAEAQLAVGNTDSAMQLVGELARSFPDRQVQGRLSSLVASATEAGAKAGRGKLTISASDAAAELFLDERKVGTGKTTIDIPVGNYRVLARLNGKVGRLYRARVEAGKTALVTVRSHVDEVLHTDGRVVGMIFGSAEDRTRRERKTAIQIATLLRAKRVVVLGLRETEGARSVIASVFRTDGGELLLAATIAVEPVTSYQTRAQALADYLAGAAPRDGVQPLGQLAGSGKTVQLRAPIVGAKSNARIYLWTGAGLGFAVMAGGVYAVLIDGDGTCQRQLGQTQCPVLRDTKRLGVTMIAGGLALTAAATYLALRAGSATPTERRGIAILPTRDGFAASLSGRF